VGVAVGDSVGAAVGMSVGANEGDVVASMLQHSTVEISLSQFNPLALHMAVQHMTLMSVDVSNVTV
jgi:hypothetical protein